MKVFSIVLIIFMLAGIDAKAQYSSQNDAVYIATLKAVVNYKINDEENAKDIEKLRSNQRFLNNLKKMLEKLSNNRTKNSVNTRVYKILLKAGKDVYDELK